MPEISNNKKSDKPRLKSINERVFAEVARELDLPVKLVKDVVMIGQSKFTAVTMADNSFDSIRWPYFGVFKAKHKVVQILQHMKGLDPDQKQFFKDMRYLQREKIKKQKRFEKEFNLNFNGTDNRQK